MWAVIGKYAIQVALWCFHNPVKVEEGLAAAKTVFDELHAAKVQAAK